jgi:formylglycine-generating enzyme required for sulfatase activity
MNPYLPNRLRLLLLFVIMAWLAPPGLSEAPPGLRVDDMVTVPAGPFWMGSAEEDPHADADERPRLEVTLEAFRIDRTEVTYRDYLLFVARLEKNGHVHCHPDEPYEKDHRPQLDQKDLGTMEHPILGIDWYDAYAFCDWAGKRLPSEAEWEKAARGTDGRIYPWGSEWDPSRANASGDRDGHKKAAPVASFPEGASPYGALDMAGNAWEWVGDYYHRSYKRGERAVGRAPEYGLFRVIRGGSWVNRPEDLRTAERSKRILSAPVKRYLAVGFRCAADS